MKKLSNKKIRRIVKMKLVGESNKQIAKHFDVTTRRIQQIFKVCWKSGASPNCKSLEREEQNRQKTIFAL